MISHSHDSICEWDFFQYKTAKATFLLNPQFQKNVTLYTKLINLQPMGLIIKEIEVKSVLTKSNLPVSDYSVNPYVGCTFACKYCYASFMKRFTNHPEQIGRAHV